MTKIGFESLQTLPSIPELINDVRWIFARGAVNRGGARASKTARESKGAATSGPDFDPLHDAQETDEILKRLQIELARIRRRYWFELIGPLPEDGADFDARARQLTRVREEYPAHWKNEEVAIVEGLSPRYVRELRGADRKR